MSFFLSCMAAIRRQGLRVRTGFRHGRARGTKLEAARETRSLRRGARPDFFPVQPDPPA